MTGDQPSWLRPILSPAAYSSSLPPRSRPASPLSGGSGGFAKEHAARTTKRARQKRLRRILILGTLTERLIRGSSDDYTRFLAHLDTFLASPEDRALFDLPRRPDPTKGATK